MCSIMGYCAQHASKEVFLKGFERTHTRGPDAMRIIDTGKGLLGFQRLSIMGLNEVWYATISKRESLCCV